MQSVILKNLHNARVHFNSGYDRFFQSLENVIKSFPPKPEKREELIGLVQELRSLRDRFEANLFSTAKSTKIDLEQLLQATAIEKADENNGLPYEATDTIEMLEEDLAKHEILYTNSTIEMIKARIETLRAASVFKKSEP